jgi:hypothetical protein
LALATCSTTGGFDTYEEAKEPIAPAANWMERKKAKGGGIRGLTWKSLEDMCLCDSWKVVCMDDGYHHWRQSNKRGYWKRIKTEFDELRYINKECSNMHMGSNPNCDIA